MNCKNCFVELPKNAHFCPNCSAEVVTERISLKQMLQQGLMDTLGWDNRYLRTLKTMFIKPENVLNDYINGVRVRYMNPFRFLLITLTISFIVMSLFKEQYLQLMERSSSFLNNENQDALQQSIQQSWASTYTKALFSYYSILMSSFIPIYALMSKFSFPKKHNYGEHLVINAYANGLIFIVTTLLFLISLMLPISIATVVQQLATLVMVVIYIWLFYRLYQMSVKQVFLAIFKFILCIMGILLLSFLIGVVGTFIYMKFMP